MSSKLLYYRVVIAGIKKPPGKAAGIELREWASGGKVEPFIQEIDLMPYEESERTSDYDVVVREVLLAVSLAVNVVLALALIIICT